MRRVTKVGLAGRTLGALVVQTGLVVAVGLLLAVLGGLVGAGLITLVVEALTGEADVLAFGLGGLFGVVLTMYAWVHEVRREVEWGRHRLLRETREADSAAERSALDALTRLAQQGDVTVPTLAVRDTEAPLCYTVAGAEAVTVVVSTGLLDRLPANERDAVLAHELAHLTNGDHRWMTRLLEPLLAAEELAAAHADAEPMSADVEVLESVVTARRRLLSPFDALWRGVYRGLITWGEVGVGLFSRGREFAADDAAATLTGDPAALAAALERLDADVATPPSTDLREHARSVDALSILPTLAPDDDGRGGLTGTHPATDRRIERLKARVENGGQ